MRSPPNRLTFLGGLRFRLAKRCSRHGIAPMGNWIAKIKKWLGLDKKQNARKHGAGARCGVVSVSADSSICRQDANFGAPHASGVQARKKAISSLRCRSVRPATVFE
jgi:hypothetical protein